MTEKATKRERKKAQRERLKPVKRALLAEAAAIYANGDKRALLLAVAASRGNEATLAELAVARGRGEAQLLEAAERQAKLMPRPPRWAPPPEGWSALQEVLREERFLAMRAGQRSDSYAALVHIAHFAPLHRALLTRVAWEMWGETDPSRFARFVARLSREPLLPEEREEGGPYHEV